MKPISNRFLISCFGVVGVLSSSAMAARLYKDVTTTDLNVAANWATTSGGVTDPASIGTSDALRFNEVFAPTAGTNYTASLSANLSVGGIELDSGSVSGGAATGNVIISAGNTLTLNGASVADINYATAGIVLNSASGGTLTINADVNLGGAQQWVTSRALTVGGNINLNGNTLSFNTAGTAMQNLTGVISGTGGLNKTAGSGTLALANPSNTFSGAVTLVGGTVTVTKLAVGGASSSLGSGSGSIVLNGSVLTYQGSTADSTDRAIDMRAGVVINNNSVGGTISFTAASVLQGGTAAARLLTLGGTNVNANTLGSSLGDSGSGANITSLTKAGAGTWVLTGANTYSGPTTLTAGTLSVSTTGNLGGAASNLVFNGGTLQITGTTLTHVSGMGHGVSFAATKTVGLDINQAAHTFTVDQVMNQTSGGFTKLGAGTVTLAQSNTYTGATTVSAGTLKAGVASVAGVSGAFGVNSAVTMANVADASLDLNGFNTQIGSLTGGGTTGGHVNFGSNILTINSTAGVFYAGKLTGTGTLALRGGSGTLINVDGTTGSSTGNYQILNSVSSVVPPLAFSLDTGSSLTDRKDFGFINDTNDVLTLSSLTGYGAIRSDSGGTGSVIRHITVNQSSGDTVFNGAILSHRSSSNVQRNITFEKQGSSALELAGFIGKSPLSGNAGVAPVNLIANGGVLNVTNAWNTTTSNTDAIRLGTVTVTSGVLAFSNQALINSAGSAGATSILMNGGTLVWNVGNTQDLTAGVSSRLSMVGGKSATFDTNGNHITFANGLGGGVVDGSLVKSGVGTLTLLGTNTYTGGTTINVGTLVLGHATDTLSDVTAVTIGGATLELAAAATDTVGSLDVTAGATIHIGGGAQLAFADSSAVDWNGGTLHIAGTFVSGSSLRFGVTSSGLTTSQLDKITADGFSSFSLDENGYLIGLSSSGYSSWATTNGVAGQSADLDHDNDGVSNGVEYFIGGPTGKTTGCTALPGVTQSSGMLSVTWTKASTYTGSYGVDYVVETSETLSGVWAVEVLGGNVSVSGNQVTYTFPSGPTKKFVRLKVTGP